MSRGEYLKIPVLIMLFIILITTTRSEATRFNMSFLYGNYNYANLVARTGESLNEVSPSYFDLHSSGNLKLNTVDSNFVNEMHKKGIKVVPFLSNHWDKEKGRSALNNIENLTTQITEAIQKYNLDGVHVDIENVTEKDRENYTLLVKRLREKLGNEKIVAVAVAANPYNWQTGWHGSYDYTALAKYADYLMLMTYDEHYEGGEAGPVASIDFVEKSIQNALEKVEPNKIVLGIPFFGRYWKNGVYYGGYGVSLTRIENLLKKYKNNVTYDEKVQSVKATITIESSNINPTINGKTLNTGTYIFWYENEKSIKAKLELVNKYNLKGTGSWSLGQETEETWNYYLKSLNYGLEDEELKKEENKSNDENTIIGDEISNWSKEAIEYVKEKGWMKGKNETEFFPKDELTRAETATILVRILNLEEYEITEVKKYSDIQQHWAKRAIELVTASGYMKGYENNTFKPEKEITREEIAMVLSRLKLDEEKLKENLSKENEIIDSKWNEVDYFSDVKKSDWSYEAIKKITKLGILKGYENGFFKPKKSISREKMAVVLSRTF